MACTHSNIDATNCDIPTTPLAVLLCDGRTFECDEINRTSCLSIFATIATFSTWDCSNTPQYDDIERSCFSCNSHFDGSVVIPCNYEDFIKN